MTRYYLIDAESGDMAEYTALMQAYTDSQYAELLADAGITRVEPVNTADWPVGNAFAGRLRCFVYIASVTQNNG